MGPDNVVPDFLSCPWVDEQGQDRVAIRPLHLLSTAPPVRHTSFHSQEGDTPLQKVKRLQTALTRDPTTESIVTHVAQQRAVAPWRMDFLETAIQWETQESAELQWMLPLTLPERSLWHQAHF